MLDSPHFTGFGVEMKKKVIDLATNSGQSLYNIARTIGVQPSTVMKHLERDAVFRQEIEHAKKWYAQRVEGVLMEQAVDPKKTIDRIAFLRAYMPEKYARQELSSATVEVNINLDALSDSKRRNIVDADVVKPQENVELAGNQADDHRDGVSDNTKDNDNQ